MEVRRLRPLTEGGVHVGHDLVVVQGVLLRPRVLRLLLSKLAVYLVLELLTTEVLLVVCLWLIRVVLVGGLLLPTPHPHQAGMVRVRVIEVSRLLLELHTKPVLLSLRRVILNRGKGRMLDWAGSGIDRTRVPAGWGINLGLGSVDIRPWRVGHHTGLSVAVGQTGLLLLLDFLLEGGHGGIDLVCLWARRLHSRGERAGATWRSREYSV